MKKRTAWKIITTPNYYSIFVNPENGKECILPISQKHIDLLMRACVTINRPDIYNDIVEGITQAFDKAE